MNNSKTPILSLFDGLIVLCQLAELFIFEEQFEVVEKS
ncbi:hypothetical protein T11_6842 [Trichinella zimbabwensis]|uniref:Uncharacterized protein n=1 Tax=Trichinella zimbabwensis TaxID=268475 RepID=A0A0V1GKM3_9BILA|nr:hypothetical protein T11_6842 [Trichinella zimbabwensis]